MKKRSETRNSQVVWSSGLNERANIQTNNWEKNLLHSCALAYRKLRGVITKVRKTEYVAETSMAMISKGKKGKIIKRERGTHFFFFNPTLFLNPIVGYSKFWDPPARNSACPIFVSFSSKTQFRYPVIMRSRRFEVDMPGVRRVGMNLPKYIVWGGRILWLWTNWQKVWTNHFFFTLALCVWVYVVVPCTGVSFLVMGYIINFIFFDEFFGEDPRCFCDDFINPTTVSHGL